MAQRVRFIAEDSGENSIVEAAVDDLRVRFLGCIGLAADLTGDGVVDIDDVLAFSRAFSESDPDADFAVPFGVFDIDDVSGFLHAFAYD